MDILIEIVLWIAGIAAFICLNILFVPAFVAMYRISRNTDCVIELFTYPLEETPTDYIDAEFTVITE